MKPAMKKNNKTLSIDQVPAAKRKEAESRLKLILEFEDFRNRPCNRKKSWSASLNDYAELKNLGITTLRRWMQRYTQLGLVGLVDTRGGGSDAEIISPPALELFKSLYLSRRNFSLRLCWRIVSYINRIERKGWKIPQLTTMYKFCQCNIPQPVLKLRREGLSACRQHYGDYLAALVARDEGMV